MTSHDARLSRFALFHGARWKVVRTEPDAAMELPEGAEELPEMQRRYV